MSKTNRPEMTPEEKRALRIANAADRAAEEGRKNAAAARRSAAWRKRTTGKKYL